MNRTLPTYRFVLAALLLAVLAASPARAQQPADDVRLPALFSDHMVVQRDLPVVVWGWAEPGGRVQVTMAGREAEAVAAGDSTWRAELAPLEAGGPHTLVVEGAERRVVEDVMVGEVWIASGQSNMEWPVEKTDRAAVATSTHDPMLRLFDAERQATPAPAADVVSEGWKTATAPDAIAPFSGVAYYFGRALRDSLGVPVGIVHSSWGGSAAEAWVSGERVRALPAYAARTAAYQTRPHQTIDSLEADQARRYDEWKRDMRAADAGFAEQPYWSDADFDDGAWDTAPQPEVLGETILPFFNGVVWFRKTVDVPADWAGAPAELRLGSMDNMDSTWVNGTLVGYEDYIGPMRHYDVPAGLLHEGENVVAVRIYDRSGVGGMRGGEPLALIYGGEEDVEQDTLPLGGDWAYGVGMTSRDMPRQPRLLWHQEPTLLYNGMIAPLTPYRVAGVIWYQGESNASRAHEYRYLFPTLIEDWRAHWDQGALPFLFVQLANYMKPQEAPGEDSHWAELREAQAMALDLPNTGMATAIDVGVPENVHPRNKTAVGRRLARQALASVYGHDVVPAGPVYLGSDAEDGQLRLYFGNVGTGLVARGDVLRGFEVAGEDGRFVWADAAIDGRTVVVSSPGVSEPAFVRYAWADNPTATLYNREGLPAEPFRTGP